MSNFLEKPDRYNGVYIYSNEQSFPIEELPKKLEESLKEWENLRKKTIWFKINLEQSEWVPILAKVNIQNA